MVLARISHDLRDLVRKAGWPIAECGSWHERRVSASTFRTPNSTFLMMNRALPGAVETPIILVSAE